MSISVQVLDISEYDEEPTVANGYTLISRSYGETTSVILSTPYTLGIQTFTTINIQTHGFIQFLNATYSTISTNLSESLSGFLSKYGIAVAWDDLQAQGADAIGYKYANNNTQIIVNYSTSVWFYAASKVQAKVTINLDNHPTSPGSIRIAYGLLQNSGGGLLGVSYGPVSTTTTVNTMNYVVSATPTNFVYPNVPVQLFSGTANNNLTNKTIVYDIQVPNRPPVLSNNITISEIYGETIHNVDLNNYTTDLDSSLTDVVYTLNPTGVTGVPNNTTLRFWMRDIYGDIYGDTWNGGYAVIRNSSNSVVATLTGPSLNNNIWIYQDIVLSGLNTITWTSGSFPTEPQLFVTSPSYSWANNGDPPALGPNVYYRTIGISNRTDTLNINTPLLGVSLSGSVLTLNSTLYNCDEFYITAKNTGKTYISNIATCSFTRLTGEQIAEAVASAISGPGELTSAIVTSSLNNNPRPRVMIIGYSSIGANAFLNASTVTSISIPSSVTSIGASAFQGMTGLTSITIRSSVTSIGANAFQGSGIKSVIIEYGMLVIPASAFQDATTVTSVTIPATVTSIGTSAFQGMTGLTSITIPSSVKGIGASAFQGMTGLTSITIPSSVTSIDLNAFQGSGITTAIFGESTLLDNHTPSIIPGTNTLYGKSGINVSWITKVYSGSGGLNGQITGYGATLYGATKVKIVGYSSIGSSTLWYIDTLTSVTISSSITNIDGGAFGGCPLSEIIVDPANNYYTSINNVLFNKNQSVLNLYPIGSTEIIYTIPSTVTVIGDSAFYYARNIRYITIPSSVTSIGQQAFYGTTGLTSITIPSSIRRIEYGAFQNMTGLTTITIPSSVTSIGENAFQESGITSAIFEVSTLLDGLSMTNGPNKTLYGKSGIAVYLPSKVFNGSGELTSTIVNDNRLSYVRNLTITGYSSIGANAFQDATGLTSITLPSSVTSIGANAFLNSGLTSAIFTVNTNVSTVGTTLSNTPQSFFGKTGVTVSALDTKIFSGSGSLSGATAQLDEKTNVVIEGYTQIGYDSFKNASNITSVTIRSGVTYIDVYAFQNATSLTSITIPASVNNIGSISVFQNTLSLTSINVHANNTFYSTDSYGVLYDFSKTRLIQYPLGNTQTSYIIPSTVITINSYAFYGAKNLKSVTLPAASTFVSIGNYAFQGATGLTSITIPSTVTNIGSFAFQNATSLTTVNYDGTSALKTIGQNAFQNATSLTSITIPASVNSISTSVVFQNASSLTSIDVHANNTTYYSDNGVLYNFAKTQLFQYPCGNTQTSYSLLSTVTTIYSNAFYGANNLKSVTLPSASTFVSIGTSAFQGALGLTSISIPAYVTSIGSSAFNGATSLTTVTFSGTSSLRTISNNAFQNATSLTSITIPALVNNIGSTSVFQNALSLISINVDPSNTTYFSDNGVLYNNPSKNTLIQYPVGNTQTSYTILSTVTTINSNAFYGANNLKSVTLPDTSTFTSIGSSAFYYATGLTSITIPSTVTNIGSNAFFGATSLTTVNYAGTSALKTIGQNAFQNATSLTSITIPASVNSISTTNVFQNASSLTSITVDPNNLTYSSDSYGVLYNAAKTQLIQYPLGSSQTSYAIPSTVNSFFNVNAFNGAKNLTAITCDPNSTVLSTDSYGILYNKNKTYMYQYPCGNTRTSYTIPNTLTNGSANPFQSAKYLKSINVDPKNTIYSSDSNGVIFNKAKTILYQYPLGNTQTTYSIPLTVTSIVSYAFQDASNLTSVTIQTPLNGTTISDYAFQNAASLKSITMPNSVTSIGFKTFQGSGLTSTKFESEINYPTFAIQNKSTPQYFLGKENVVASTIVPRLVLNGFGELTSTIVTSKLGNNTSEVIITGYSSIGASAFQDALGVTSITIPSSVTSIGSSAFQGMTGLTSMTIPSSMKIIGASAFNGMTGLTSITIPSSVTSIGLNAFQGSGITTAIFAESTLLDNHSPSIIPGTNTLYGKSGVNVSWITKVYSGNGPLTSSITSYGATLYGATKVKIDGYSSIGSSTFWDNNTLTSVTITSSITNIDGGAFGVCPLTEIIVDPANNYYTSINNVLFNKDKSVLNLYPIGSTATTYIIPSTVHVIGSFAFFRASTIKSITIPSSVTSIGAQAFYNNTGLTSITIPSSVRRIEYGAFQYMTGLTTITIPSSVTSIGENAFQSSGITTAIFAESTLLDNHSPSIIPGTNTLYGKSGVNVSWITKVYSGAGPLTSSITSYGATLYGVTKVKIVGYSSIGNATFWNNNTLTSVTITSSITNIDGGAFGGCPLTEIIVDPANNYYTSINNVLFNKDKSVLNLYPIGSTATTYIIPSTVHVIGSLAFFINSTIKSITIPSSVTSIGAQAFYTTGLTSVTIPSSMKIIGARAFQDAASLANVTFQLGAGDSSVLTSIEVSAFQNTALTTALFDSASTVNTLGLPYGDLINGYTVSSFYGKSSVTFIYTEATRAAIVAAPAAIISNSTFTSLLTDMNVNISNVTSEVIPIENDPYVEYSAKLTIPEGDLSTLTEVNKANIIETVKYLYATQLGVNVNKIIVTLQSGSIIANVNVLKGGITEASIPICFPKGTPVTTNQGVIAIEKLNPDIHTIRGKKIVAITQTRPLHKYIISIEKDALGDNVPSAPIQISKEHKVYYKGEMVKAKDLVEVCEGVTRIPYSGETLYNVLMEKHDKMMINNVICETLDPKNIMAKICGGKYNHTEQDNICKELNDIIKADNVPAYKKLYASLK